MTFAPILAIYIIVECYNVKKELGMIGKAGHSVSGISLLISIVL